MVFRNSEMGVPRSAVGIDARVWRTKKPSASRGLSLNLRFCYVLAKMITRVYRASDSISARPRIRKS
jgi:hypothetical protein